MVAQTVGHLVSFYVSGVNRGIFNADGDSSLFGWIGAAATASAAIASLVLARFDTRRRVRFTALGLALLVLLVDSRFRLHERLSHGVALILPFVAVALALLWTLAPELPGREGRILRAGTILYFASLVLHQVGLKIVTALGYGAADWPYQVKIVIKEDLDRGGWILIASALVVSAWVAGRHRAR